MITRCVLFLAVWPLVSSVGAKDGQCLLQDGASLRAARTSAQEQRSESSSQRAAAQAAHTASASAARAAASKRLKGAAVNLAAALRQELLGGRPYSAREYVKAARNRLTQEASLLGRGGFNTIDDVPAAEVDGGGQLMLDFAQRAPPWLLIYGGSLGDQGVEPLLGAPLFLPEAPLEMAPEVDDEFVIVDAPQQPWEQPRVPEAFDTGREVEMVLAMPQDLMGGNTLDVEGRVTPRSHHPTVFGKVSETQIKQGGHFQAHPDLHPKKNRTAAEVGTHMSSAYLSKHGKHKNGSTTASRHTRHSTNKNSTEGNVANSSEDMDMLKEAIDAMSKQVEGSFANRSNDTDLSQVLTHSVTNTSVSRSEVSSSSETISNGSHVATVSKSCENGKCKTTRSLGTGNHSQNITRITPSNATANASMSDAVQEMADELERIRAEFGGSGFERVLDDVFDKGGPSGANGKKTLGADRTASTANSESTTSSTIYDGDKKITITKHCLNGHCKTVKTEEAESDEASEESEGSSAATSEEPPIKVAQRQAATSDEPDFQFASSPIF